MTIVQISYCTGYPVRRAVCRNLRYRKHGVGGTHLSPHSYLGEKFLRYSMFATVKFPFLRQLFIQAAEGCRRRVKPPPIFTPPAHTFRCSQYESWDQSPKTYIVPAGDFCSGLLIPPARPECARNVNRDAPRISIFDGEGTDCSISMMLSPGTQFNSSKVSPYWSQLLCQEKH